jgi:hypothetical protein
MKSVINRALPKNLASLVSEFAPHVPHNYRSFSVSNLVDYSTINVLKRTEASKMVSGFSSKILSKGDGNRIDLENKEKVLIARTEDIEKSKADKFTQVLIVSENGGIVKYGEEGIAPSKSKKPADLLNKEVVIPALSLGVLNVKKHVPFSIVVTNPLSAFALAASQLGTVLNHEENIQRYSLTTLFQLKPEDAKRFTVKLQNRLFDDSSMEQFFEELTSVLIKPTYDNRSSATIMNFENDQDQSRTTDSHFHPGERSLFIITTAKPSGVILNFCGVKESPEKRKDCEKALKFPSNSIVILNFASYVHHKFHGDFSCISFHPREGLNIIEAITSPPRNFPKGFLESATVFSKSDKDPESWQLSTSQPISSPSPSLSKPDSKGVSALKGDIKKFVEV